MIIAVDIDEVIAETLPAFLLYYNVKHQTAYVAEDFETSDWGERLNLTTQSLDKEIGSFIKSPFYSSLVPVTDSFAVLKSLRESNSLHAVTSRWGELKETTSSWLSCYFPQIFEQVHFSKTSHANVSQGDASNKSDICRSIGASFLVEDCPKHAADCSANGISVILYDRPWNKNFSGRGVFRVASWESVKEHLCK